MPHSERTHSDRDDRVSGLFPFLLGFNAQIIQLILFREALVFSNGSETALGICLAAWALFNGTGALAGRFWLKKRSGLGRLFSKILLILPLFLALGIHLARVGRGWIDIPGGEPITLASYAVLASVVLAPVTFFDGLLFVSALERLFGRNAGGRGTSFVYGVESLGSLAGGLLLSLVLVELADPFTIAGALLCLNALLLHDSDQKAEHSHGLSRGLLRVCFFVIGASCLICGPFLNRASESLRWRVLQPDLAWMESLDTRYQNLAVLSYRDEYSLFGNTHLLHTLPSAGAESSADWEKAVLPHFAMLQPKDPENLLIIGGGTKGLIGSLLAYGPKRLDWVEYDRGILDISAPYLSLETRSDWQASAVLFHETDGRYFVKTATPECYDLILVDLPDPSNANLNRYYTMEFFQECRRILMPKGVLVIGISSQPNYIGEAMLQRNGSVFAALRAVFPQVLVTPGDFSYFAAGCAELPITAVPGELVARYESREPSGDSFSPFYFYSVFEEDDLDWINKVYEKAMRSDALHPNNDNRPIAYFSDYKIHAAVTAPAGEQGDRSMAERILSGTGGEARAKTIVVVLAGLGLLLFVWAMADKTRKKSCSVGQSLLFCLAAFVTGFSGIVLEMVVLFTFQNGSGYLYSQMGVIIALYMAGLSAGALLFSKRISTRACFFTSLAALGIGVAGAYFLLPVLGRLFPGALAFLFLCGSAVFLMGVSGGFIFRGIAVAVTPLGTRGGGLIYAMDILGTCLGGLVAGSTLIPCWGLKTTMIIAAGLTAALCVFAALALLDPDAGA